MEWQPGQIAQRCPRGTLAQRAQNGWNKAEHRLRMVHARLGLTSTCFPDPILLAGTKRPVQTSRPSCQKLHFQGVKRSDFAHEQLKGFVQPPNFHANVKNLWWKIMFSTKWSTSSETQTCSRFAVWILQCFWNIHAHNLNVCRDSMAFGCSSPTARAHPGWAAGQKKTLVQASWSKIWYELWRKFGPTWAKWISLLFRHFDVLKVPHTTMFADQTLWHHQSFRHSQVENDLGIPDFFCSRVWRPINWPFGILLEGNIFFCNHIKKHGVGHHDAWVSKGHWCCWSSDGLTFPNSSKQTQFPFLTPWDVLPLPTSVHLASHGGHGLSVPGGLQMAWSLDTRNEHPFWGVSHQRNTLIRWVKMSHSWLPEKDQNGWSYYCCK